MQSIGHNHLQIRGSGLLSPACQIHSHGLAGQLTSGLGLRICQLAITAYEQSDRQLGESSSSLTVSRTGCVAISQTFYQVSLMKRMHHYYHCSAFKNFQRLLDTMKRKLLISGERADFTTLAFDEDKAELRILANYPAPFNASWVELSSSKGGIDCLVGLSEGFESGSLYTFKIDHEHQTCTTTSSQPTLGAPAHCKYTSGRSILHCHHTKFAVATLRDQSAIALATVSES